MTAMVSLVEVLMVCMAERRDTEGAATTPSAGSVNWVGANVIVGTTRSSRISTVGKKRPGLTVRPSDVRFRGEKKKRLMEQLSSGAAAHCHWRPQGLLVH